MLGYRRLRIYKLKRKIQNWDCEKYRGVFLILPAPSILLYVAHYKRNLPATVKPSTDGQHLLATFVANSCWQHVANNCWPCGLNVGNIHHQHFVGGSFPSCLKTVANILKNAALWLVDGSFCTADQRKQMKTWQSGKTKKLASWLVCMNRDRVCMMFYSVIITTRQRKGRRKRR